LSEEKGGCWLCGPLTNFHGDEEYRKMLEVVEDAREHDADVGESLVD
jgi:hypothetical protein